MFAQIPTIGFLYVAGYIGSVGREYLNIVKKEKKPTDKEIIIDVPLALKLAFQGAGWPLRVVQQLRYDSSQKGHCRAQSLLGMLPSC